jgi:ketosteroid isomerase-like protein
MLGQLQTCALSLCLVVAMVVLPSCRHAPDEDQVRHAIAVVAQAAQAGDSRGVVDPLTEDFDGNAGELDKRALANMMRLVGLRGDHIGVITGPVGIEHRGDRMIATLTVTLTSGGHVLPDQLGVYQVQSAWRKDDGQWRCYSATWKSPSQ